MDSIPQKRCTVCGEEKPATPEYWFRQPRGLYGLKSVCKICSREYKRTQAALRLKPEEKERRELEGKGLRRCVICKVIFPATTDHFYQKGDSKRNLRSECLTCYSKIRKEKYQNNKNQICAERRAYRAAHPERIKASNQKHYWNNREKLIAQMKRWRVNNIESRRLRARENYTNPLVKAKAFLASDKRRTLKKALPFTFTLSDWDRCLEYWGYKCCVCGKTQGFWIRIAKEHWIALSDSRTDNPGTVVWNILPMCHSIKDGYGGCNNTKHNADPIEWLNRFLGKKKAKAKLAEIEAYFEWVRTKP